MFNSAGTFVFVTNEDGSYSILGRVCALQGTGTAVNPREGNPLKQADVGSITAKVFNLGTDQFNESGTEITPAPTLTAAANVYDTLQTSGWPTDDDPDGYNFRHDLSPTYCPTGANWYLIEYKITLTSALGSGVIWGKSRGKAAPVQTS